AQDGWRHRPGRIQCQSGDRRFQRRSTARLAADLGTRLPLHLAFLEIDQPRAGDIYQQRARFEVVGDPAQAFEVDAQLIEAGRRADVERRERGAANYAVWLQAVLAL